MNMAIPCLRVEMAKSATLGILHFGLLDYEQGSAGFANQHIAERNLRLQWSRRRPEAVMESSLRFDGAHFGCRRLCGPDRKKCPIRQQFFDEPLVRRRRWAWLTPQMRDTQTPFRGIESPSICHPKHPRKLTCSKHNEPLADGSEQSTVPSRPPIRGTGRCNTEKLSSAQPAVAEARAARRRPR